MSCVELVKIDGLDVHIRNFDMLDKTPVLDLKPYIPAADAFPEARTGWLEKTAVEHYEVTFTAAAAEKAAWILSVSKLDLKRFCEIQLGHDPLNKSRKRVCPGSIPDEFIIACRTWRIRFSLNELSKKIEVTGVESGYTAADLDALAPDPYADKAIHREFIPKFRHN